MTEQTDTAMGNDLKKNPLQPIITNSQDRKAGNSERRQREEGQSAKMEAAADTAPTLEQVIKEQAIEGEAPFSSHFTLRKILCGDILSTSTIRKQVWLLLLITLFTLIYVSNRYSYQQGLIKLDKLEDELQDAKYRALSTSSQLTEKCRESNVLDQLKNNKDSVLKIASQPPYKIEVPEE